MQPPFHVVVGGPSPYSNDREEVHRSTVGRVTNRRWKRRFGPRTVVQQQSAATAVYDVSGCLILKILKSRIYFRKKTKKYRRPTAWLDRWMRPDPFFFFLIPPDPVLAWADTRAGWPLVSETCLGRRCRNPINLPKG